MLKLVKTGAVAAGVALAIAAAPLSASAQTQAQKPAPAQTAEEKPSAEDVQRLMAITKAEDTVRKIVPAFQKQIGDALRQSLPEVSKPHFDEAMRIMADEFQVLLPEFVKLVVPVYQANLTKKEITTLIDFYSTPAGQSIIEKMPKILLQSQQMGIGLGQAIAEKAVRKMQQRLRDRGYKL